MLNPSDLPWTTITGAVVAAIVYISLFSLVREPQKQIINALIIAGAGSAYWSGGLGVLEFPFGIIMIYMAYKGLCDYRFIAFGWMLHTGWDVIHHLYANPIVEMSPTSSLGCAIFDPILAIWFWYKAPDIFQLFRRQEA